MSASTVADIATWYLIGEIIGALFFGRLSDRLGRRNLFLVTLGVYLVGSGLTAATPAGGHWFLFLYLTRIIAGAGIGGEYAAINSAIDEMIPAMYRGRVDLAVNGAYWAGAIIGTLATLLALAIEVTAWLAMAAGLVQCLATADRASLALAIIGATCIAVGLRPDRRRAVWAGLVTSEVAWCVLLAAAGIGSPEPYAVPAAAMPWRRGGGWPAAGRSCGPG